MTRNNSKNNFNIAKIYGAKVFDDTVHYQKKYNWEMGNNKWKPCSYQRLIKNHLRQKLFVLKSFSTV